MKLHGDERDGEIQPHAIAKQHEADRQQHGEDKTPGQHHAPKRVEVSEGDAHDHDESSLNEQFYPQRWRGKFTVLVQRLD